MATITRKRRIRSPALDATGAELLTRLQPERARLKCAAYPVRDAFLDEYIARADAVIASKVASEVGRDDWIGYLIDSANGPCGSATYSGSPLANEAIDRIVNKLCDRGVAVPPTLVRYQRERERSRRKPVPLDAWREGIERDHLVVEAMRWLVKSKGWGKRKAAACVADVMDHLGVRNMGSENARLLWRMADGGLAEDSLIEQEAHLLREYDRGRITYAEYRARLPHLEPKVISLDKMRAQRKARE